MDDITSPCENYCSPFDSFWDVVSEANEKLDHDKRRPRETKYDTNAFYNFKHKRRKKK